jgi:hypothetical protein
MRPVNESAEATSTSLNDTKPPKTVNQKIKPKKPSHKGVGLHSNNSRSAKPQSIKTAITNTSTNIQKTRPPKEAIEDTVNPENKNLKNRSITQREHEETPTRPTTNKTTTTKHNNSKEE